MDQNFGTGRKVLPQGISMLNLKALSLSVQELMPRLSFFQKKVKRQGQGQKVKLFCTERKVLPQEILKCNMKAPCLLVKKLCLRLSYFKSRSKVKVKVTRSKFVRGRERKVLSHGTHM